MFRTDLVYFANRLDQLERIGRVYAKVAIGIERRLKTAGYSPPARRVLLAIGRDPERTAAEIADELTMKPSLVSRSLKQLVADTLVEKAPSTTHRSKRLLKLTQQGVVVAQDLQEQARLAFIDEASGLAPREEADLIGTLDRAARTPSTQISSEKVQLTEATPADLVSLFTNIVRAVASEFDWHTPFFQLACTGMKAHLAQGKGDEQTTWIAKAQNASVGGCLLTFGDDPMAGAVSEGSVHAWIAGIYVVPALQRRTIGERLLEAAIDAAEDADMLTVSITVAKRQVALTALIKRAGFRPRGKVHEDWRTGTLEQWRDWTLDFPRRKSARRELRRTVFNERASTN